MAISVLTVRIIGANIFGKYQYCLAIVEFPAVLYSGFDRIINRFSATERYEDQLKLLLSSYFVHFIVSLVIFFIFFIHFNLYPYLNFAFLNITNNEGEKIFYLTFLFCFISGILNTITTYLNGIRKIQLSQYASLAISVLNFLFVLFLYFIRTNNKSDITQLLVGRTFILLALIIVIIFNFKDLFIKLFFMLLNPKEIKKSLIFTFEKHFKDHASHYQITEILGYLKDRIAILILGNFGHFSGATFYEIIKNVISILRKFFVQMFNVFIPQIVYSHDKNKDQFVKRFKYFSHGQFFITCLAAVGIIFVTSLILKIYSLENLKSYYFITYLECLTLVVTAWANSNNFALEMFKDSKSIMEAAIGRTLIVSILSPILISKFEVTGAAWALLTSTISNILFLCFKNRKNALWSNYENIQCSFVFAITVVILYFCIDISFKLYSQFLII